MADLDKVLKGLERCAENWCSGDDCPYFTERDCDILKKDALELLKSLQTQITELKAKNSELFSRWLHEGR